jgi:linoleoyl-CoA desaturase
MAGYVYIHEKFYDLDRIKKEHPGGCLKIFECLDKEEDCTALFESSHAMKDLSAIKQMMKDYEIKENQYEEYGITAEILEQKAKLQKFQFETYHKLTSEVKKELGRNYKVTPLWYFKVILILVLYLIFYYFGLISNSHQGLSKYFSAFLAGLLWINLGFCTMHDASHYALFNTKSKNVVLNNDFINSLWQGWALWNSIIWFKHHTYAHHSFTGIFGKDPDLIHGRPLFRKNTTDSKILKFFGKLQDKLFILVLFFLPGMYLGQVLAYFIGILRGHVWKVDIRGALKMTPIYEKVLYLLSVFSLVQSKSPLAVISYLIALNIGYAICIVPDHDTFESTIENEKQTDDWAEMEIRKSSNFSSSSKLFTEMNGGINYQIEHHLFPTVSHCHYDKISPIINAFCKQNNIPYVVKKNLLEVYYSYKKMLQFVKVK